MSHLTTPLDQLVFLLQPGIRQIAQGLVRAAYDGFKLTPSSDDPRYRDVVDITCTQLSIRARSRLPTLLTPDEIVLYVHHLDNKPPAITAVEMKLAAMVGQADYIEVGRLVIEEIKPPVRRLS